MKHKISLTVITTLISLFLFGQKKNEVYATYIVQYSKIAIEQQTKYKIPASITLAQGLLESRAGTSKLAQKSNNHFGIKCNRNWQGETVRFDDDRPNECFRKYNSVENSFEDHSRHLSIYPRYASLFKLNPTDYKAWAYGLKNAGYATDKKYAEKLIKIIDDFDLHKYDVGKKANIKKMVSAENSKNYTWKTTGKPIILTGHKVYWNNGVKCIVAEQGDTFDAIANEFKKTKEKLLYYNDLQQEKELKPNTIIYIRRKKTIASQKSPLHKVEKGDTMYKISQRYAIRLQELYDLNGLSYTSIPKIGQVLMLR